LGRSLRHREFVLLCWLAWACLGDTRGLSAPLPSSSDTAPPVLSADTAVRWALEHNPELAALRQQHGIAAAGVVIADTYPFNRVWEAKVRPDFGPESGGVSNAVSNEHKLLFEVEVHHQRARRREAAAAALSRTDWEIAFQEVSLAVRTVRAFNGVLYRYDKQRLVEDIIALNERAEEQVRKLVGGRLRPADLILVRAEVE